MIVWGLEPARYTDTWRVLSLPIDVHRRLKLWQSSERGAFLFGVWDVEDLPTRRNNEDVRNACILDMTRHIFSFWNACVSMKGKKADRGEQTFFDMSDIRFVLFGPAGCSWPARWKSQCTVSFMLQITSSVAQGLTFDWEGGCRSMNKVEVLAD